MKLRLVRTTFVQKAPRYAVLFADGTMIYGLNFSRPKIMSGEPDETAKAKEWRDVSCRILRDVLAHYDKYEYLSAENYGIDDTTLVGRWDGAETCGNMSLWGSNNYATELIISDAGRLCVYNPLLTAFARVGNYDDFSFPEHDVVKNNANSLMLRLVKTKSTLREGLYLLWWNGVREQVCIDESNAKDAKRIIDILSNYVDVDQRLMPNADTVDDSERWDKDCCEASTVDEWCANYATVFAVTFGNILCVKDPTVLQTLQLVTSRKAKISFTGAKTVTPLQYCYLALQAGLFDDRLDDAGIIMDRELHRPVNPAHNEAFEKKFKNYRIRVLKILKASYDHEYGDREGFPFACDNSLFTKDNSGAIEWYLPVYYPGDPEYEKEFGAFGVKDEEIGRPCLPRYPEPIKSPGEYKPIRITEAMQRRFEEYLEENNKVKANSPREDKTAMPVYSSIKYIISRNKLLSDAVKEAQNKGWTSSQELADALFDRYAGTRRKEHPTQRNKLEFRHAVEARLDTVQNKKCLFYAAALECQSLEEVSSKVQYSEGYVHKLLSSLKEGKKKMLGDEVGPNVYYNFTDGVRHDLEKYDAVKAGCKSGKTDEQISEPTGLPLEEVAQIHEKLVL